MASLKNREKILLGGTGFVLIIFLVNQFVCGKPKGASEEIPAKTKNQATSAGAQSAADSTKKDSAVRKRVRGPRVEFAVWGRDPFAETYRLAVLDSSGADSSDFVLRGVIRKGNDALVLIGDEILREGDERGDLKILDIEKNRVVCKKRGKIITLVLENEGG